MKTLSVLKGQHQRGVCAVDFSGNNIFFAYFHSFTLSTFLKFRFIFTLIVHLLLRMNI